jgi:hypothetical protein
MSSTTFTARSARGIAAGLAVVALAAPAQARPLDPQTPYPGVPPTAVLTPADVHDPSGAGPTAVQAPVVVIHSTGFDWADAGVGAAATGGLVALLGAGLIVTTRSRRRGHAPHVAH